MFTSILIIILFFFFFSVLILPSFISFFLLFSAFMYNFSVNYVHWMHHTCTTSSRKAATKTKHLPLNSQHVTSNVYQKCNEHRFHKPCIVWLFYTLEYSFLVFLIRRLLLLFFVLFSVREQFILIFVCCCYFYTKMYHFIYECTKKINLIAHQDNVNNKNIYKKKWNI